MGKLYALQPKKQNKKPVIILRSQISMQANIETARRFFGNSKDYVIAHSVQRCRRAGKSKAYFLTLKPV